MEAAKVQFTDNGGNIEDFVAEEDPTEEEFKRLMGVIKEKRSKQVAELERQKEENLQVKLSIIEELKELVESGDDANKSLYGVQRSCNSNGMIRNWCRKVK